MRRAHAKTLQRVPPGRLGPGLELPALRSALPDPRWGFEYKSKATLMGLPLVHVAFKYRPNRLPVPARGVIAIGQFACAYSLIAQIGVYIHEGRGQIVRSLEEILKLLT